MRTPILVIHSIDCQISTNSDICTVPAVEMLPDAQRHNLVVEMLHYRLLHMVTVAALICIKQVLVFDETRTLVEKLRLLIFIFNCVGKRSE